MMRPLHIAFYHPPYNGFRFVKLYAFNEALCHHEAYRELPLQDATRILVDIEKSCRVASVAKAREDNVPLVWKNTHFKNIYHAICARVLSNLNPSFSIKNQYLLDAVIGGKIQPRDLGSMSARDMFPERYVEIDRRIAIAFSYTQETTTHTTLYKCGRCHKSICRTSNTQFRALDESSGVMVTCLNCGNKWHIG